MRVRFASVLIAGLAMLATVGGAQTSDERASARAIVARRSDAVINVAGSIKVRVVMGGREFQNTDEPLQATAAVLDGTGLAVMSLVAIDPSTQMNRLMAAGGTAAAKMEVTSEVSSLRMRLADGQELPARVVLREKDLNVAFVKPINPPKVPMAFVDGPSGMAAPLDLLVMVARLGESSGWKPSASFAYVQAVVDTPRTVYLVSGGAIGGLGAPVFDLTGRFVGLTVFRGAPTGTAGGGPMSGLLASFGGGDLFGMLPVVLPADDIRAVARQTAEK